MAAPAQALTANPTSTRTRSRITSADLDAVTRDVGLLVLRMTGGLLFAAHGAQKLFGWWGGPDFDAVATGFAQSGYSPGKLFALIAGLSELVGGLLLAVGLLTPLASAAVIGVMFNAIVGVHWSAGVLAPDGYEMALLFGIIALTLSFTGPGRFSLDRSFRWANGGAVSALVSLGVGLGSAILVMGITAI